MSCNGDISNKCGETIFASCVDYEGNLGANTKITEPCVNQQMVNEDLYSITDDVITAQDVSAIASTAITIPANATIAQIVALLVAKVDEFETEITALQNIDYGAIDITGFGLTIPACIADSCANPPTTLAEWMQVMMDQRNCT